MKKILITSLCLFLVACSDDAPINLPNPNFKTVIDPALTPYTQTFLDHAANYGVSLNMNITVKFASRPLIPGQMNIVGVCWRETSAGGSLSARVEIAEDYWASSTELMRNHLIYHELGHCLLYRNHLTTTITQNSLETPVSLMFPNIFSIGSWENFVSTNWAFYLDELFTSNYSPMLSFGPIYNLGNGAVDHQLAGEEIIQVINEDGSCQH